MELRNFTIILYDISEFAYLFVGIYALMKSLRTGKYSWLAYFLVIVGTIRVASIFMADKEINTMCLYHLIGGLDLFFAFMIYHRKIAKSWKGITIGLLVLYVLNSVFLSSLSEANNIGLALIQVTVLLFSFSYMYKVYKEAKEINLGRDAFFYFNAGFMIYASGSFFVNLLSSQIGSQSTNDFFNNAWIIEAIAALVRLVFFVIGLQFVKNER